MDLTKHETLPTVGVICELNPLHNGHAYLLAEAKGLVGPEGCVICVMSGCATQRGEMAVVDPFTRGRTALLGGADLVVELPFPHCAGSAEVFAQGGVHILSRMGVKDVIFGSECGDLSLLQRGASTVGSQAFSELYAELCRRGMGTAAAYAQALRDSAPELPQGFPSSNDLLGIAYLSAIRKTAPHIVPHTLCRRGQDYRDELLTDASFPSATALRNLIREASCDPVGLQLMLEGTMPEGALEILLEALEAQGGPADPLPLLRYAQLYFRLNREPLFEIAETGGGLWAHLHRCALETETPEAFAAAIETRQYTRARLRRALLFALTGVTSADLKTLPSYTQVLAANKRGRAYLSSLRKQEPVSLKVITKPADAPEGRQRRLSQQLDALFTACLPLPREAGWLIKKRPYIQN